MVIKLLQRFERVGPARVGVVLVVLLVVVGTALFQKARIGTTLRSGEAIQVVFARDYQLRADVTKVKVAGVTIGVVDGVEHREDGTTLATLKVDNGVAEKLRAEPSAAIRPATLLGGNYYVELEPGGDPGRAETIPAERTSTPVELDRVLEVFKSPARLSSQRTIGQLDSLLETTGQESIRRLTRTAPGTLRPLTPVLDALRGTQPDEDLTFLVSSLEGAARALDADPGTLDGALRSLAQVSSVLADTSPRLTRAVADLPSTLRTTRQGMQALGGTLDTLRQTSDQATPTAVELSKTLSALEPALRETRPLLTSLRPALQDLRPVITDLVPVAGTGTQIFRDVDGAPIDRVKGPVLDVLNSPWKGSGIYEGDGGDTVLYKELGDLIAGMNRANKLTDRNGATLQFMPGFGLGSVTGTPLSLGNLLTNLLGLEEKS